MITSRLLQNAAGGCFLILTAFLASCSNGDDSPTAAIRHPQDFLPQEIGGMATDGAVRVATTVSELQEIVDGGYQTYTQHGFREIAEQNYAGTVGGTQTALRARIFVQGTTTNATALYVDVNVDPGGCSILEELGDEARLCTGLISLTLQFRRDLYWIELVMHNTSVDARGVLELAARHIDGEIQGD